MLRKQSPTKANEEMILRENFSTKFAWPTKNLSSFVSNWNEDDIFLTFVHSPPFVNKVVHHIHTFSSYKSEQRTSTKVFNFFRRLPVIAVPIDIYNTVHARQLMPINFSLPLSRKLFAYTWQKISTKLKKLPESNQLITTVD